MASDALEIARTRELLRDGRAKAIRLRAGLARSEVARALSVDDSTVARWEAGVRIPRADAAVRYGRLLRDLADLGLR